MCIRDRLVEEENERVSKAISASPKELGLLLNASHQSLQRIGVSLKAMDKRVTELQHTQGVLGARMMGGGFGGMILVLVEHQGILPEAIHVMPSESGFVQEFL